MLALKCRAGDMAPCLMPCRGLLRPTRYKHGGKVMEDSGSHFFSLSSSSPPMCCRSSHPVSSPRATSPGWPLTSLPASPTSLPTS